MLKSNLAVLMAERGLKIADVFRETGISKTTLMALSDNKSQGVQFETIDKLCNFFGVTPDSFFVFSKYMLNYDIVYSESLNTDVLIVSAISGNIKQIFEYACSIYIDRGDEIISRVFSGADGLDYYVSIDCEENADIGTIYKELPPMLKKDVDNKFYEFCLKELDKFVGKNGVKNSKTTRVGMVINYDDYYTKVVREFDYSIK